MPGVFYVRRAPRPVGRLLCFPAAGVGATPYRTWAGEPERGGEDGLDVGVVCLPGRESRFDEEPVRRMDDLLPGLLEELRPHLDVPVVLFGHCCGALIAFEVGRRLAATGGPGPRGLLVAGRRAPMLPASRTLSRLPAGELVVDLVSRGGMSPDAAAIPELVEFILPAVRADLELEETYRYQAGPRLECPVVALVGASDHTVPAEAVGAWSEVAPRGFQVESIPGDHFAIWGEADRIVRFVRSRWLH